MTPYPLTTLRSERRELAYDKLCSYVSGQREHSEASVNLKTLHMVH